MKLLTTLALVTISALTLADYQTTVIKSGLSRPTGITVTGSGHNSIVFFSQVPTPGVSGANGGHNSVDVLIPGLNFMAPIHQGEPDPRNLAFGSDGSLYWTCKSAGVILERKRNGSIAPLLTNLPNPSGVAVDRWGTVFYTTLPTPGVPGTMGGMNTVNSYDGNIISQLTIGEPEPTDIAVNPMNGNLYWTCRSAGVILQRTPAGIVTPFLRGLNKPTGITIDRKGNLFFTEVPTPGVSGSMGGGNFVWEVDLVTKKREVVHFGDPEPTDVAVDGGGRVYWTCSSAGVIVRATKKDD